MHVEGLGDVCSLATFDLARHGNPHYGSPIACPKVHRQCIAYHIMHTGPCTLFGDRHQSRTGADMTAPGPCNSCSPTRGLDAVVYGCQLCQRWFMTMVNTS